jgi:hypothetical protein
MKPTFEHTVNVLVNAYLNDELEHRVCTACAVGNIVAAALGTKPALAGTCQATHTKHDNYHFADGTLMSWWTDGIGQNSPSSQQASTGYRIDELNRIEVAFEMAEGRPDFNGRLTPGFTTDETWMFNGLMAVVDVLADIHGVDLSVKENAKLLFVK